jgi:hypothetical protein
MADDNILGSFRSDGPVCRADSPAVSRNSACNNPLAELEPTTGRTDPSAVLGRSSGHSAETQFDWRQIAAALARESTQDWPFHESGYQERSIHLTTADSCYSEKLDADSGMGDRPDQIEPSRSAVTGSHEEEQFPERGPPPEHFYDNRLSARRTNALLTAGLLVGCGILGTVGANGYSIYYSVSRPTDAPVISAEKPSNKVLPRSVTGTYRKPIQDRLGEKVAEEQIVTRPEEPVTLLDLFSPNVILPARFTPSPGPDSSVKSNFAGRIDATPASKTARTVADRSAALPTQAASFPAIAAPRQPRVSKQIPLLTKTSAARSPSILKPKRA